MNTDDRRPKKSKIKRSSGLAPSNPKVVLVHGEDRPREVLADLIESKFNIKPILPEIGDIIKI